VAQGDERPEQDIRVEGIFTFYLDNPLAADYGFLPHKVILEVMLAGQAGIEVYQLMNEELAASLLEIADSNIYI
jgi:hypothetical protein